MSEMGSGASAGAPSFAPSELVVLFGDRFAEEGGMLTTKEEVLTSGTKVSAEKLGMAAALAALYASHARGTARLSLDTTKAMFGLTTKQVPMLAGSGAAGAWPAGSIEDALAAVPAPTKLEDVVAHVIAAKTQNPWQRLVLVIKAGLAGRGLLEVEEGRVLKVIRTSKFTLPDSTRDAAGRMELDAVRETLDRFPRENPELARAVEKAVRAAAVWMTESND